MGAVRLIRRGIRPFPRPRVRCRALASVAGGRNLAILPAMYAGGMRAGELAALELGDWTEDAPDLHMWVARGCALRTVRLGPRAADVGCGWVGIRAGALARLFLPVNKGRQVACDRLTASRVRVILRKLVGDAGLEGLTAHDVRHTAIHDLWRAGTSVLTVMRAVGGASPRTLERGCRSRSSGASGIGRAKERGWTGYHRREHAERDQDILALLRR